jgi:hypothetical protein
MGNRNSFKKVLEHLLNAEQLLRIGVEKGNLSTIERDILLEKLRASYEQLLFDKEIDLPEVSIKQDFSSEKETVKAEPEPQVLVEDTDPQELPIEVDDEPPIESEQEFSPEVAKKTEKEVRVIKNVERIETIENSEKAHSEILGEKYQGKKKFRNEMLGSGKKDMASVLQNKPIFDLTKAIGINDKFLYTKELFNGNAELYSKTIKQLNEFSDINDALIYIQDNFSWDDKNEAANQLIDLVRRKLLMG